MIAGRLRPVLSPRCYHLWPHNARVLDLGDDAHAAVHVRDFAMHDYALRGVRWREAGSIDVIAYYDGQHQSALTQDQRALVRAWVRRHATPTREDATLRAGEAPFWTSYVAESTESVNVISRAAPPMRGVWLALATLLAAVALALVGYAFGRGAPTPGVGVSALVSTASVLALISAVIALRQPRHTGPRAAALRDAAPVTAAQHARPARLRVPPHASM